MARSGIMAFTEKLERKLDRAEYLQTATALGRSIALAPVEDGDLIATGRVEKNPDGGRSIIFGNTSVRYARKRHFENKKNPQTLLYLKRGGDSTKKEGARKYIEMSNI